MRPTVRFLASCVAGLLWFATCAMSPAASADSGGGNCAKGFRTVDGTCQPIAVPDNAYLTERDFGRGWECQYGHRLVDETCRPVVPPAHGFVSGFSGDQWSCDRTYLQKGDRCVAVELPANAVPANRYSSSGWTCERGYQENAGRCERIAVPANAYLDSRSPTGWACERGYQPSADRCQRIVIPPNGYLSSAYGMTGFECERGFRTSGSGCAAIAIPANAHLDNSGNDWDCNRPYRRQQDRCRLGP
ncbi:MAG: uncharacterized protein K0Q76_1332 [Panacagrimonas sp.]|jgi:hypothetical protein|nr:hypothetical protein [Panacagrimonas sp.]MCC2656224.1 uncharacterized protein [Panacagrimonas sp.]